MKEESREVVMNKKTNLLQLEEHFYQLVDVDEPNVFHNLFPYNEIPKIAFNDRIVPHNMPEEIWITDTTFRDGQQSRAPLYHGTDRDDLRLSAQTWRSEGIDPPERVLFIQ